VTGGPGLHIAFVGVDGAGKSTQAARLVRRLRQDGRPARLFEPGPQVGLELLRRVAANAGDAILDHWGVDLALAVQVIDGVRAQTVIPSMMATGSVVVSVKGLDVRRAQAAALGAGSPTRIADLVALADAPEVTIYLRLEPDVALRRIACRGIDDENTAALAAFGVALDDLAQGEAWVTVEGSGSEEEVAAAVWAGVSARLRDRRGAG
jgi:dTMP kinase